MSFDIELLMHLRYWANNSFGIVVGQTTTPKGEKYEFVQYGAETLRNITIHLVDVAGYSKAIAQPKPANLSFEEHNMACLYENYVGGMRAEPLTEDKKGKHCIPLTYKTGSIVANPKYRGHRAGRVLQLCLAAILFDEADTRGITTDRLDVAPGAAKSWQAYMSQNIFRHRKTTMGNTAFDYTNATPNDIYDDCESPDYAAFGGYDAKGSFGLTPNTYNKVRNPVLQLIENGRMYVDIGVSQIKYKNKYPQRTSTYNKQAKKYLLAVMLEMIGDYLFDERYPGIKDSLTRRKGQIVRFTPTEYISTADFLANMRTMRVPQAFYKNVDTGNISRDAFPLLTLV